MESSVVIAFLYIKVRNLFNSLALVKIIRCSEFTQIVPVLCCHDNLFTLANELSTRYKNIQISQVAVQFLSGCSSIGRSYPLKRMCLPKKSFIIFNLIG